VYDTVDLHFLREARQVLESVRDAIKVAQILSMVKCGAYEVPYTLDACLDQLPNREASQAIRNHTRYLHALMKQEIFSMRVANVSLMLSSIEKDIAISLGIAPEKLHIVSNIYADADIDNAFHSLHKEQSHSKEKNGAIFVGNMQHVPNISALKHLIKITDKICKHYPNFIMHIVGSHPSFVPEEIMVLLKAHNNIQFHGWLSDENLKLIYKECVASFVPLLSGAGVKGKVASAYLHGVPVVATEVAVEGMGLSSQSYISAHDSDEYYDAYMLLRANVDLRNRMALAGLVVLRQRFSMSAAARALADVVKATPGV
jgi:glycosyltransferase involved in cell wall biosynthesis